jgi:hypothetical protein
LVYWKGLVVFKVYDNIIPIELQNNIKDSLFSYHFPWYYLYDNTYTDNPTSNSRPCFTHWYYKNYKSTSLASKLITDLTKSISTHINFGPYSIIQARSFMQLFLNLTKEELDSEDTLHIDLDFPHTVFLYYVADATGDTVLSNYNKYDYASPPKEYKIIKRVTPKQGRVLVFDGSTWHAAYQPYTKQSRCIVNIDLKSKDNGSTD